MVTLTDTEVLDVASLINSYAVSMRFLTVVSAEKGPDVKLWLDAMHDARDKLAEYGFILPR